MAELNWGAATHTGQVRPENEDSLVAVDGVFVVADGMGGHEAGEVASAIAVDRISAVVADGRLPTAQDFVGSINDANTEIFRAALANPGQRGMGTTVTAIAVIADPMAGRGAPNIDTHNLRYADPGGDVDSDIPGDVTPVVPQQPSEALVLANVGDSRTYLFRHDRLRRVTVDHNYVQELVATGHISEDEARTHPRRNIITRALGIEPDVKVDWWTLPLIRGDRFLLCSDGLSDYVDDVDITSTITIETDPQSAADRLVEKANEAGGPDNITVIVVDVLDGDDPPDPTQEIDVVPTWADEGADPTPAGTLEVDADAAALPPPTLPDPTGTPPPPRADDDDEAEQPRKKRRLRRFLAAFAAAALIVIAFVVFAAWARGGFYVAFDDSDEVIIYKGRNGGVLWFEPTPETAGGPSRDDLSDESIDLVEAEPEFDSRADAERFIGGLQPADGADEEPEEPTDDVEVPTTDP